MTPGEKPSNGRFRIEPILEEFGAFITPRSSKLKCPFHDDENASGYIPESRQYFKCLACGVAGDAVRLLHDQGGLDWRESYRKAEELAGPPEEEASTTPLRSHMRGSTRTLRGHSRFGSGSTGTS